MKAQKLEAEKAWRGRTYSQLCLSLVFSFRSEIEVDTPYMLNEQQHIPQTGLNPPAEGSLQILGSWILP